VAAALPFIAKVQRIAEAPSGKGEEEPYLFLSAAFAVFSAFALKEMTPALEHVRPGGLR
jgi:hypothetical protein